MEDEDEEATERALSADAGGGGRGTESGDGEPEEPDDFEDECAERRVERRLSFGEEGAMLGVSRDEGE